MNQGNIEQHSHGIITGWVYSSSGSRVELHVDDKYMADISADIFREDVLQAGIGDGYSGFYLDLTAKYSELIGDKKLTLMISGDVIFEKIVKFIAAENYILNPYLELENKFSLKDAKVHSSYRQAIKLNRFHSPESLELSNGSYTRISFLDYGEHTTKVEVDLDYAQIPYDVNSDLNISLVAKSQLDISVEIGIKDNNGNVIFSEYITLGKAWEENKIIIPVESASICNGVVYLSWDHKSRGFVDISKLVLSTDVDMVNLKKSNQPFNNDNKYGNIINNGELLNWSNGFDFSNIKRGEELADNWILEYHKSNKNKINSAVHLNSEKIDDFSTSISPKLGLRIKTEDTIHYSRLVLPFLTSDLEIDEYTLSLDLESKERVCIGRIYLIACDMVNDTIVYDFVRKHAIVGRQKLEASVTKIDIENIQSNSKGCSSLKLAIELPRDSDLCFYSAVLKKNNSADIQVGPSISDNIFDIAFEDESITNQLGLLKGLDSWSGLGGNDSLSINSEVDSRINNIGHFEDTIPKLIPHKFNRPSRNFPFIDIIVPVYNACDDVLLCLSALIEKTDLLHRVIVINDGEDERTADMLAAFNNVYNHLEVITNEHNLGYTKSVNKGIEHSNADWVVVLNSDTIVSKGWLGRLMNCALSEDKVGMVGALSNAASWQSVPYVRDKVGDWHLNPLPEDMSVDDMAQEIVSLSKRDYPQVGVINGFCQLINTRMLDEIGLLDDVAFPIGYGEENDMCARAVKAGYKLLIADDTYVFHAKSKSFGHEKRKVLAKQGSAALKKKHPDVNWGEVTKLIFENTALVSLREQLAQNLELKGFK